MAKHWSSMNGGANHSLIIEPHFSKIPRIKSCGTVRAHSAIFLCCGQFNATNGTFVTSFHDVRNRNSSSDF